MSDIRSELESALAEIGMEESEKTPPPKGWKTTAGWAEEIDRSVSHTRKKLRRLVDSGKWGTKTVRVLQGNRLMPVPYYGPLDKK